MTKEWPFGITPENYPEFMGKCSEHSVRKGKDMAGYYLEKTDPKAAIYEVYESETNSRMCMALTVIRPGKVGKEFHMTKGHYHEDPDAGEVYFCLKGNGIIIMQNKKGETEEIWLMPGAAANIPPGWAHRSVNTGKEELIILAVYPATSGHDYATIEKSGFARRVVEEKGKPKVIQQ